MTRTSSARYEGDTWDLASSVGVTATMVAAARAVASRSPDRLINDQFAEPLVRAVGIDFFSTIANGELDLRDLDDDTARALARFADAMAVRTEFFDSFFLDATRAGIRQVVILASGLDSRAYRLPWPAGTVVYEIDQPRVIDFKSGALADLGAEPTAERRTIAIDLRNDWPTALRQAGFESARPTAWIAEGLLGYLPAQAQDQLLDQITTLSVPDSRLAVEALPDINEVNEGDLRRRMQQQSDRWRVLGFEFDMAGLVYFDERTNPATYLAGRGWETVGTTTSGLLAEHGLPPIDPDDAPFGDVAYLSATLTGTRGLREAEGASDGTH